jgi:hypothetical protein
MFKYDALEYSRIIGEAKNPKKPYPNIVSEVCELDSADPNEYVYYFDALVDTDYIYTTVASGVEQKAVSVDTPTQLTFVDRATPEYYAKITDLVNSKERTLARKRATVNRALNGYEIYYLLDAIDTAATGQGNHERLKSGSTWFNFENLIDLIDIVIDYGDSYSLIAGTQIDKDIKLWNWNDDKNQSVIAAFKELNVNVVRVPFSITLDDATTNVLDSETAYLLAKDTEMGKPCLFVRKRLDEISGLKGILSDPGDSPERLVFVSPNPVSIGSSNTRYLAVGMTGYENIVTAVTNPYALTKFTRN